jgi:hypothetical protein
VPGGSGASTRGPANARAPSANALARRQEATGEPLHGARTGLGPVPPAARLWGGSRSPAPPSSGDTPAVVAGRLLADATAPIIAPAPAMAPTSVSATLRAAAVPTASITGRITGPDGRARAEIEVIASNDDDELGPVRAFSDASGAYALGMRPGRWRLHVEAPAYQLQWYRHASTPFGARAVELAAGEVRFGADFALVPYPRARIAGRVRWPDGAPAGGALAVAVPAALAAGQAEAPVDGVAGYADDDGAYTLFVEPGAYYVGAAPDSPSLPLVWWPGGSGIAQARVIDLGADGAAAEADFELVPGPRR